MLNMNRKMLLFLLFLVFPFLLLQSQENQDIDVLHHIDEVQVTGSAKKEFSAGTHIQKMDSIVKATMDHGSLADDLSAHLSLPL